MQMKKRRFRNNNKGMMDQLKKITGDMIGSIKEKGNVCMECPKKWIKKLSKSCWTT
jgi:hypothetical protein